MGHNLKTHQHSDTTNGIFHSSESRVDGSGSVEINTAFNEIGLHSPDVDSETSKRFLQYWDGFQGNVSNYSDQYWRQYSAPNSTTVGGANFLQLDGSDERKFSLGSLCRDGKPGMTISAWVQLPEWGDTNCWGRTWDTVYTPFSNRAADINGLVSKAGRLFAEGRTLDPEGSERYMTTTNAIQDFPIIHKGFVDLTTSSDHRMGTQAGIRSFHGGRGIHTTTQFTEHDYTYGTHPMHGFNYNKHRYTMDPGKHHQNSFIGDMWGNTEYCLGFMLIHVSQLAFSTSRTIPYEDRRTDPYNRESKIWTYDFKSLWNNPYNSGWILMPYLDVGVAGKAFFDDQKTNLPEDGSAYDWNLYGRKMYRDRSHYQLASVVRCLGTTVAPFKYNPQYFASYKPSGNTLSDAQIRAQHLINESVENNSLICADPSSLAGKWVFISATMSEGGQVQVFFEPGPVQDKGRSRFSHHPLPEDSIDLGSRTHRKVWTRDKKDQSFGQYKSTGGLGDARLTTADGDSIFGGVSTDGRNVCHQPMHLGKEIMAKCVPGASAYEGGKITDVPSRKRAVWGKIRGGSHGVHFGSEEVDNIYNADGDHAEENSSWIDWSGDAYRDHGLHNTTNNDLRTHAKIETPNWKSDGVTWLAALDSFNSMIGTRGLTGPPMSRFYTALDLSNDKKGFTQKVRSKTPISWSWVNQGARRGFSGWVRYPTGNQSYDSAWGPSEKWYWWTPHGGTTYTYEKTLIFSNGQTETFKFTPWLGWGRHIWASDSVGTKNPLLLGGRAHLHSDYRERHWSTLGLYDPDVNNIAKYYPNRRVHPLINRISYSRPIPVGDSGFGPPGLSILRIGARPHILSGMENTVRTLDSHDTYMKSNGRYKQFAGRIDAVRVWERVLTKKEILELYNLAAVDDIYGNPVKGQNKNLSSAGDSLKKGVIADWSFDSNLTSPSSVESVSAPSAPSGLSVSITEATDSLQGEDSITYDVNDYYLDLSWTNNASTSEFTHLQVQIIDPDLNITTSTNNKSWYDMDGLPNGKSPGEPWLSIPPGIVAQEGWESTAVDARDSRIINSIRGATRSSCDNTHNSLRIIRFPELSADFPNATRQNTNYNLGDKFRIRIRAVNLNADGDGDQFFSDWSNVVTVTMPAGNAATSQDECDLIDVQHVSNDLTAVSITQSGDKKVGSYSAFLSGHGTSNTLYSSRPTSTSDDNYNLFANGSSMYLSNTSHLYENLPAGSLERCSFRPDKDFVMAGWFKIDEGSGVHTIASKWDHTDESKQEWILRADMESGQLQMIFRSKAYTTGNGDVCCINITKRSSQPNITSNVWYHVAFKLSRTIRNSVLPPTLGINKSTRAKYVTTDLTVWRNGLKQNYNAILSHGANVTPTKKASQSANGTTLLDIFDADRWQSGRESVNLSDVTNQVSEVNFAASNKLIFGATPGKVNVGGAYLNNNTDFAFEAFSGGLDSWGYWTGPSHELPSGPSLYNNGTGRSYSTLTDMQKRVLVAFWDFEESSGDRLDSTTIPAPPVPTLHSFNKKLFIQQNYFKILPISISGAIPPPQPISASGFFAGGLYTVGHAELNITNQNFPKGLSLNLRTNVATSDGSSPELPLYLAAPILPTRGLSISIPYATTAGKSGFRDSLPITMPYIYDPETSTNFGEIDNGPWQFSDSLSGPIPTSNTNLKLYLAGPSVGKIENFTVDGTPILTDGAILSGVNSSGVFPLATRTLYINSLLGTRTTKSMTLFAGASIPSGTLPLYIKMKRISTANVTNDLDAFAQRAWGYIPHTGAIPLYIARPGNDSTANRMPLAMSGATNKINNNIKMFLKIDKTNDNMNLVLHNFTSNKDLTITMEA